VGLDAHNHLWDCSGEERYVSQRQVVEEKYMVEWSWKSELMARMISRFPNTETRYMHRNISNRIYCMSETSERPMIWNSETGVRFCSSILLAHL
jgi:hypothetical protein